jgi:hypothetical protein
MAVPVFSVIQQKQKACAEEDAAVARTITNAQGALEEAQLITWPTPQKVGWMWF